MYSLFTIQTYLHILSPTLRPYLISYSLNLNQWIITDISAKYATGNQ